MAQKIECRIDCCHKSVHFTELVYNNTYIIIVAWTKISMTLTKGLLKNILVYLSKSMTIFYYIYLHLTLYRVKRIKGEGDKERMY